MSTGEELATKFISGLHTRYFMIVSDPLKQTIVKLLDNYLNSLKNSSAKKSAHDRAIQQIRSLKEEHDNYKHTDRIILLIQLERFMDSLYKKGLEIADYPNQWELERKSLQTIQQLLTFHRNAKELQQEIGRKCIHALYEFIITDYSPWRNFIMLLKKIFNRKESSETIVHSEYIDGLINLLQEYRDGLDNRQAILNYIEQHQNDFSKNLSDEKAKQLNDFIEYITELLTYLPKH